MGFLGLKPLQQAALRERAEATKESCRQDAFRHLIALQSKDVITMPSCLGVHLAAGLGPG